MLKITNLKELQIELAKGEINIIKIGAEWCGPCKLLDPVIKSITSYNVIIIDVDESPDIAGYYKVSAVPTTLITKGSEVIETVIGNKNKSHFIDICDKIKEH